MSIDTQHHGEPSQATPVLGYAIPPVRGGRPFFGAFAAVVAVVLGLFGALTFFYGVAGIPYVFFDDNRVDFPGDLFVLIMFLLIGSLSLYFAIRWCRQVGRIISGR